MLGGVSMYRVFAMGCGLCVVALLAGTGHSGDPKKEQKDQPPKKQIQLPSEFLTESQKEALRKAAAAKLPDGEKKPDADKK